MWARLLVFLLSLGALEACEPPRPESTWLDLAAPPARFYRTEAEAGDAARGDLGAQANQAFIDLGHRLPDARQLRRDDRLAQLAELVADYWRIHEQAPTAALDFMTHHLGLLEPAPHLALLEAPIVQLQAVLQDELANLLVQDHYSHVGLFAERTGLVYARIVVVLSARNVQLASIARELSAGASVRLQGRLTGPYTRPTLVVTGPQGATEQRSLGVGQGLDTELRLPSRGRYQVELLAEGEHGPTVVANFPLYVQLSAPHRFRVRKEPASENLSPSELEQTLLELLNDARRSAHVPEVEVDLQLRDIAARHNQDMLAQGYVGHTSPTTGGAGDRTRAAGVHSALVLENVGRAYSAEELHTGWLNSPGHRATMLHPLATHVGIAVAVTHLGDGPPQLLATQLYVQHTPPISSAARQQVWSQLNRARKNNEQSTLPLDAQLSTLCQEAANRYFARPERSAEQELENLHATFQHSKLGYKALHTWFKVTSDIDSIASDPALLDPRAVAVGVGLQQGSRPGEPRNTIAAVLILAY